MKSEKTIYAISALLFIIAAIFSIGFYHPDEHFQILEFAAAKLGWSDPQNLPWEYSYSMRSAIQPFITVVLSKIMYFIGLRNHFFIATLLRLLSAAFFFSALYSLYQSLKNDIAGQTLQKWFLYLSFLLWFLFFTGVRFSSESWSASAFILGFSLIRSGQNNKDHSFKSYILAGLLFGLAFLFRFQVAIMVAGLMLRILVVQRSWKNFSLLIPGGLLVLFIGLLIDRWFYGKWTISFWNYWQQNIILKKSANFGVQGWFFYPWEAIRSGIPPFSLVYIFALFWFFISRPKDSLTWALFPFVLAHFLVGHKELRFLFPLFAFLPYIVIKTFEIIENRRPFLSNAGFLFLVKMFWLSNAIAILVVIFKPADPWTPLYENLYRYRQPAVLFYTERNPFFRSLEKIDGKEKNLNIDFYKRKTLEVKKVLPAKICSVKDSRLTFYVTRNKETAAQMLGKNTLLYRTLPAWLSRFNFNHWLDRISLWYIFKIEDSFCRAKNNT